MARKAKYTQKRKADKVVRVKPKVHTALKVEAARRDMTLGELLASIVPFLKRGGDLSNSP